MSFTDRVFEMEGAYLFKDLPCESLEEYLLQTLGYQLSSLENIWYDLIPDETAISSDFTFAYRMQLERIVFRLQEIIEFIKHSHGPKIISFICSEISDLFHEKIIMETALNVSESNQISVVLTGLNTYFQPEIFTLNIVDIATISKDLKNAVNVLLQRLR
ncbi:MAG: hypothetical protein HQM14_01415 [SAR324 cluster bacterium]|nr:hypothetical protein [SAR324 cluster bacterium]